jgi:hypothetical protein
LVQNPRSTSGYKEYIGALRTLEWVTRVGLKLSGSQPEGDEKWEDRTILLEHAANDLRELRGARSKEK